MNPLDERDRKRGEMRRRIDGPKQLEQILSIADELHQCAKLGNINPQTVAALRSSAELRLKVLNKVLPDLKSVEQEDGESRRAARDEDINARIVRLIGKLQSAGVLTGVGGTSGGDGTALQ
jgi:hypothetical protein